jgi:hypothetical protein
MAASIHAKSFQSANDLAAFMNSNGLSLGSVQIVFNAASGMYTIFYSA